jgi:phospholipid transport system substrate-binding protein
MLRRLMMIVTLLMAIVGGSLALAGAPLQPTETIQNISNQLDHKIRVAEKQKKINEAFFKKLVKTEFLPNIDLPMMSQQILGHSAWLQSSPAERAQFITLFTNLVIQSYAHVANHYTGHKIIFRRAATVPSNQLFAEVRSVIVLPDERHVMVNYLCARVGSVWKVYDFTVDGVSFVNNYRAQFAHVIEEGGLPSLIKQLEKRLENRKESAS